jgi:hypothetical protein
MITKAKIDSVDIPSSYFVFIYPGDKWSLTIQGPGDLYGYIMDKYLKGDATYLFAVEDENFIYTGTAKAKDLKPGLCEFDGIEPLIIKDK